MNNELLDKLEELLETRDEERIVQVVEALQRGIQVQPLVCALSINPVTGGVSISHNVPDEAIPLLAGALQEVRDNFLMDYSLKKPKQQVEE